ncbi:MAG: M28 family peptidase, partial [Proteobacteria bacterium]|nr:M28 family peptidase [Pseudomonadota bacterium]
RGGNLRRLTTSPGYDGGPFFSPDGSRIVWRRFSEDGVTAEIYSMKVDGSDVRQITRLGALSWAPFYHPSGDTILFSTNLHGMGDFELYLVDAEGRSEPVRVTRSPDFDGLPAFSPDGSVLAWTSQRGANGRSQIFLADWDAEASRRALGLPGLETAQVAPLLPLPRDTAAAIDAVDLRAHVDALTSDVAEGRLTGTRGERIAASYVARSFRAYGLEPAGDGNTFFQQFGFTAGVALGANSQLASADASFTVERDWRPLAFSRVGEVEASPVVFAGYGMVVPETVDAPGIDSYADLDVTDKWVLVLRYAPKTEGGWRHRRHASLRYKAMLARDRGARGLLVVSGPRSKVRDPLVPLAFDASLAGTSIAAVSISDDTARSLLGSGGGHDLDSLQRDLDAGETVPGFTLEGVHLRARIDLRLQRSAGRNVIGRLRMGEEPSERFVLVGAHLDHLGRGKNATSLARAGEEHEIHRGADDNASGVAAVLEMAQLLADARDAGRLAGARDVVFAAWSGEELGLLGSKHFADGLGNPDDPHASLSSSIAAYLNLDMVGRMEHELYLYGAGSSSAWPGLIERASAPLGLAVAPRDDSFLPTDATSFYLKRVPVLSAFTGVHEDYHTPRDLADRLNYGGLRDVARLMARLSESLARLESTPDYRAMKRPRRAVPRGALRAYLGSIPDYAYDRADGVRLSGVAEGAPVERAGLRAGDVVVELAGRKVENIYDYTFAIESLEIGEPVVIVIRRDGERRAHEVVPESRD